MMEHHAKTRVSYNKTFFTRLQAQNLLSHHARLNYVFKVPNKYIVIFLRLRQYNHYNRLVLIKRWSSFTSQGQLDMCSLGVYSIFTRKSLYTVDND